MAHQLLDAYPEAKDLVTDQDQELCDRLYGQSLDHWAQRLDAGLLPFYLGIRAFRAYVDIPNPQDPSDNVVIVGGEHGNSYWAQHDKRVANPSIVRAHVIRDMVDKNATLIYSAGNAIGEDNFGLDISEIIRINRGDSSPISDRWNTVIDSFRHKRTLRAGVGMSLSATVLSDAMARGGLGPVDSVVSVETGNIISRTRRALGKDFFSDGKDLAANIRLNASPDVRSPIVDEHIRSVDVTNAHGARGAAKYIGGLALPANLALLKPMCEDTLQASIEHSLSQGTAVVHAWGVKGRVSPKDENRRVRDAVGLHDLYHPFEFGGDHSMTNVALIMGGLARYATKVKQ